MVRLFTRWAAICQLNLIVWNVWRVDSLAGNERILVILRRPIPVVKAVTKNRLAFEILPMRSLVLTTGNETFRDILSFIETDVRLSLAHVNAAVGVIEG